VPNIEPRLSGLSLVSLLKNFYGPLPAPPRDPFALFVWEVLSARSTPRKRDAAFAALRRIRALTPDALSRTPQKKLEASVALAGAYLEQRVGALKIGAEFFRRSPGLPGAIRSPIAAARRALTGLPASGDDSVRRMLLFAADHPVLPLDAAAIRVARRLGYGGRPDVSGKRSSDVRSALTADLGRGPEVLRHAYIYLSNHGAATCTDRDPHCAVCPLRPHCPFGRRAPSPFPGAS
jgi:endonuclease III